MERLGTEITLILRGDWSFEISAPGDVLALLEKGTKQCHLSNCPYGALSSSIYVLFVSSWSSSGPLVFSRLLASSSDSLVILGSSRHPHVFLSSSDPLAIFRFSRPPRVLTSSSCPPVILMSSFCPSCVLSSSDLLVLLGFSGPLPFPGSSPLPRVLPFSSGPLVLIYRRANLLSFRSAKTKKKILLFSVWAESVARRSRSRVR